MQRAEFLNKLGDANFQVALLANPRKALRKVGVEVPASAEVKVVRNSKNSVNVVIPVHNTTSKILSDDQLGQLAAGEILVSAIFAIGFTGIVAAGLVGWGITEAVGAD